MREFGAIMLGLFTTVVALALAEAIGGALIRWVAENVRRGWERGGLDARERIEAAYSAAVRPNRNDRA